MKHIWSDNITSEDGIFFWFALLLYVLVNSYGRVGIVSSPNQTFFHGQLE